MNQRSGPAYFDGNTSGTNYNKSTSRSDEYVPPNNLIKDDDDNTSGIYRKPCDGNDGGDDSGDDDGSDDGEDISDDEKEEDDEEEEDDDEDDDEEDDEEDEEEDEVQEDEDDDNTDDISCGGINFESDLSEYYNIQLIHWYKNEINNNVKNNIVTQQHRIGLR